VITAFALLLQLQDTSAADSVRLCVRDAVSGAPVVGATLRDERGVARVINADCTLVPRAASLLQVARVGYRPQQVVVQGFDVSRHTSVIVSLVPRTAAAGDENPQRRDITVLATQRVVASVPDASAAGTVQAAVTAETARERGVTSMNGVISLLPYTTLRSARGESGLSLRGARREQVVITLDGLPLNDPATGLADIGDLPLAAVQSATVKPGADPLGAGSGASGGVLALSSASQRLVSVRSGAFGQWAAEGAWAASSAGARWSASLSHRRAVNDFVFRNEAGAEPVREQRVNNDEQRTVFSGGVVAAHTQWNVLLSTGTRGMVGPANVRAYDEDRSHTTRLLLRGQTELGSTLLTTGVRHFALAYRDPTRPALDSRARAWAGDVEWRGAAPIGTWRLGTGADGLTGTGNLAQRRVRGFLAWGWQRAVPTTPRAEARLDIDVGVRADVVERNGAQPTGSAGVSWRALGMRRASSLSLLARTAQAVRVPTLYDLYFSSPQRLSVRALSPERVILDAHGGVQGTWQRAVSRLTGEVLLVSRDTRDAIIWFPGNFGWSPANVGRERLRGTEARAEFAAASLTLGAWHTWYVSALRSGGLTIPTPYVPQQSVGVQGAWRLGAHRLSTNIRHQGRRPFTAGPRNPLFELPAVTLADVAWSREHTLAHLRALLSVAIENVTDVRWQSVRGFPMPGRGWSASLTLQPRP
jgi:outer membrane cobalamin receptor